MATETQALLSGSTNGRPIAIGTSSGTPTLLHASLSTAGNFDNLYVDVVNNSAADITLTLLHGGTGTSDQIKVIVPPNIGPVKVLDGRPLAGGVTLSAYASATGLNAFGFVYRRLES